MWVFFFWEGEWSDSCDDFCWYKFGVVVVFVGFQWLDFVYWVLVDVQVMCYVWIWLFECYEE